MASRVPACGIGWVGVRRDKTALAEECDPRCGTCSLTGEELVGGTGGTGSLSAHTGGQISSNGKTSLSRFAISVMIRETDRSHNCATGGRACAEDRRANR